MYKPIPFKISKSHNHALLVQVDEAPYFYRHLHYHPEIQITAVRSGEGVFYAGNSMSAFAEEEVFLIGSNVPHLFKNSAVYYGADSPGASSISLFFDESSFGPHFFEIKELESVKELLKLSKRVVRVRGKLAEEIYERMIASTEVQNERLIINFLEILSLLSQANLEFLNGEQYLPTLNAKEGSRLNEVLNYTFRHYNREIKIEQIAGVAYLSRSQFSHFFKVHTGKTYIRFLNELRIENACILLTNSNATIEQICYEVGFQNVSNFVRQFKTLKGMPPSHYRQSWITKS